MRISIITAAYNSGRTLHDTMCSVLSQSHRDFEHIIVDGGSKDNTINLIQELEPQYNGRLRWISEPDRGIYDAMNKGIAMATGDVIGILNSDDFYTSKDVLTKVAMQMMDDRIDAVYGDIHFVDDDDLLTCVRYYSSRYFYWWMMPMGYQPAHPSFYCRKSVYEKYGAFDLSFNIASDFEHMLRVLFVNRIKTRYIPMDFVTMRTGGASTAGISSHRQIILDHYRAYKKHGIKTGFCMDFVRYPFKVAEIFISRIRTSYKN